MFAFYMIYRVVIDYLKTLLRAHIISVKRPKPLKYTKNKKRFIS